LDAAQVEVLKSHAAAERAEMKRQEAEANFEAREERVGSDDCVGGAVYAHGSRGTSRKAITCVKGLCDADGQFGPLKAFFCFLTPHLSTRMRILKGLSSFFALVFVDSSS
jgi:hypothetical protein